MRNNISIISAAGILPPEKIIIHPEDNIRNEFSAPGEQQLSRSRTLWRLEHKKDLIELMKVSLLAAVKQVQMDIPDIDYLILSQVWSDNILGDEAGRLARELKLSCPVVSVNVGTSGGATGLEIATAMFANSEFHNIAVIAGCNYSHWFSMSDPARTLLSDGAACLVLSRKQGMTVTGCHTLSTAHYDVLQFNEVPERYVYYKPKGGEYIFNNMKETIYQCCNKVCQSNGISLNEVSAFYVYDPSDWVASAAAEALGVGKDKIISIFHKYGSLGPAQSFFGFMEMQDNKNLTNSDWVIVMGLGPSTTATAVLFRWQHISCNVYCYNHKTQLSNPMLPSGVTQNI
ncbi:3-oxoacyl-[acyl-carrier-protein] synthase III C-terminal domain-containing protein [Xenorhabdus bovienii]|uniref:3-oxoacyl-[acyl-carrier-protein] synthase III C-terminal domain-containing protein n=1 Tax=Xenorhabdus bovienii TaxID=40576 RepID=UPI00237C7FF5|nr:3-oxoacyl-[acyl-carrier-protein] synthase III C-terminal domain-containing protein [Xenorhabdus bovienii]MDE1492083.1 hypothetical protein [Xenorhabdus bovienii]